MKIRFYKSYSIIAIGLVLLNLVSFAPSQVVLADLAVPANTISMSNSSTSTAQNNAAVTANLTAKAAKDVPSSNPNRGIIAWGQDTYGQVDGSANIKFVPTQLTTLPTGTQITNIATGDGNTMAVDSNGQVWGWGDNSLAQLGDGTTANHISPVPITFPVGTKISTVSLAIAHGIALSTDGKVYQWGRIPDPQLPSQIVTSPLQVKFQQGVSLTQISAGGEYNLALDTNSQIWAWGINNAGQFGNNMITTTYVVTPTQITIPNLPSGHKIISVKAGARPDGPTFSLALADNGQVWAWGDNSYGQLGDGTTNSSLTPKLISNLSNITSIASAAHPGLYATAVDNNGKVYLWGTFVNPLRNTVDSNTWKQNSAGYFCNDYQPEQLIFSSTIQSVALGPTNLMALSQDSKTIYPEGADNDGELGIGNLAEVYTNSATTALNLPQGVTVNSISAGYEQIAAITSDGSLYVWGGNTNGELGVGQNGTIYDPTLFKIPDNVTPKTLAAGNYNSFLLSTDGKVYGWGLNNRNQAGADPPNSSVITNSPIITTPTEVPLTQTITSLAVNAVSQFGLALDTNGHIWAWGPGGDPTGTLPDTVSEEHLPNDITATLITESDHDMALGSDGKIYAWGLNNAGQLGNGITATTSTIITAEAAVQVQLPPLNVGEKIVQILASGQSYFDAGSSMALTNQGRIFAWGDNTNGQLGLGPTVTATVVPTPREVFLPNNVTATKVLKEDYGTAGAIGADGKVYFWGINFTAQTITNALSAGPSSGVFYTNTAQTLILPDNQPVTDAMFGGTQMLIRTADGELFGGMFNAANNLVKIPLTSNPALFAVGLYHTLVWFQDDSNTNWSAVTSLPINSDSGSAAIDQNIIEPGSSKWYSFTAGYNSVISITLSGANDNANLPADYDLSLHTDLPSAYTNLISSTQTAAALSEDSTSDPTGIFWPDGFWPDGFWPDGFWPSGYWPDGFWPSSFSPSEVLPASVLESLTYPETFTPAPFQPTAGAPAGYDSKSFFGAVSTSLLAASAQSGLVPENILHNTWGNSGVYYIQVKAKENQASLANFHLTVTVSSDSCGSLSSQLSQLDGQPVFAGGSLPTNHKTLIVTDFSEFQKETENSQSNINVLQSTLATFAQFNGVDGEVVDLSSVSGITYPRVAIARNIANSTNYSACPYAKNLLAQEIKKVVDAYAPSSYIVLVGDDDVVPFFRYPDLAGLAAESEYSPPVSETSAAQASLQSNLILGQDEYGSSQYITRSTYLFPVPDKAVGRLVRSALEINQMLDVYMNNGGLISPNSALVTGYSFATSTAKQAGISLGDGIISPTDNLISETWSAQNLKDKLSQNRYDVMFLSGHFSAGNLMAADGSQFSASELVAGNIDRSNSLVLALGCHSGYSIPDLASIPGASPDPDWVRAFAQQGMTSIVGTGYQYGDTDVIAYSSRLYLDIVNELRSGPVVTNGRNSVTIGQALALAKKDYLSDTAQQLQGMDEKSLLEATLYGLPMQSLSLVPAASSPDAPVVTNPTSMSGAGQAFDLASSVYTLSPIVLTPTTTVLTNTIDGSTVNAVYYTGSDGTVANSLEPIFPLAQTNVTVANKTLRGAVVLTANYTDQLNVSPLTVAPATEYTSTHPAFASPTFYPSQFWGANFLGSTSGGTIGSKTQLVVVPAQYRSNLDNKGNPTLNGTFRTYQSVTSKLYYVGVYTSSTHPSISGVTAYPTVITPTGSSSGVNAIHFIANVATDPQTAAQEVWATYTSDSGSAWYGQLQSLALYQDPLNANRWIGDLVLPPSNLAINQIHFLIQAVSGAGMVTVDTNSGKLYDISPTPNFAPVINSGAVLYNPSALPLTVPTSPTATSPVQLTFVQAPDVAKYDDQPLITVQLKDANNLQPLSGQPITLTLAGQQTTEATTDGNGLATFNGGANNPVFTLLQSGVYSLTASFVNNGSAYQPAVASKSLTVLKRPTTLVLNASSAVTFNFGEPSLITATLKDDTNLALVNKLILFKAVSSSGGQNFEFATFTDANGNAALGSPKWQAGSYQLTAEFSVNDPQYAPATTSNTPLSFTLNPANLSAVSPLSQAVVVNSAIGKLQVKVQDPANNPLPNVLVKFVVDNNGNTQLPSATFAPPQFNGTVTALTDASGVATSTLLTANSVLGSYNVVATIVGSATPLVFQITNANGQPSVSTADATSLSDKGATLQATVNANGSTTTDIHFEYGLASNNYTTVITNVTPSSLSGTTPNNVSATVSGLQSDTTYYYRVVAANGLGTTYGNEKSFHTSAVVVTNTVYTYFLPFLANNAGGYTSYLAFQNVGTAAANFSLKFSDISGATVGTPILQGTCAALAANAECIPGNPFNSNQAGSGVIVSDQPLNVIVAEGTPYGGSAYAVTNGGSNNLVAPLILKEAYGDFNTRLTVFNGGSNAASVTVTFYDQNGDVQTAANQSQTVAANTAWTLDQATSNLPTGFNGWAQISAPTGSQLVAQVLEQSQSRKFVAIANAQPNDKAASTLYAPAIFKGAFGFVTGANIVNPNSNPVQVTIIYYDDSGKAYPAPTFTLNGNSITSIYQSANSGNGLPTNPALPSGFSGAAIVKSSGGNVLMVVNESGGVSTGGTSLSGVYAAASSGSGIVGLPVMANGGYGYVTGATILNTSSNTVNAIIQYYNTDGTKQGSSHSFTIGPNASQLVYQGDVAQGLSSGFYGTAIVTENGGGQDLIATTNAESGLFYTYTEPNS